MNNIRKNTPTENCPWKRRLSVTSEQMEHRNRHVKRWPIIIDEHLYYKNNVSFLVKEEANRKSVATMCTTSQQKNMCLLSAINVTFFDQFISIQMVIKYAVYIRLSSDWHERTI